MSEEERIFMETQDLYFEKFGVMYGVGMGGGYTLAEVTAIMEKAIKSGKPAPDPEFEGIAE